MRIVVYDGAEKKVVIRAMILLDEKELKQLIGYAEDLLVDPNDHSHLNDESFKRELTIARSDGDRSKLNRFTRSVVESD